MTKNRKVVVSLLISLVVMSSIAIGAYAANKYNLIINGKQVNGDIIVKNGVTYVPLRIVSESLGANVTSSGKNITVSTNTNSTPSTKPTNKTNSRSNPAAVGTSMSYQIKSFTDNYSGQVSILETLRGEQAHKLIIEANPLNKEPKEGHEFLLVKASISVDKNASDKEIRLSSVHYNLISTKGVEYDTGLIITPEPDYSTNVYLGAKHTGWIAFEVKKDDANPLIVFNRTSEKSGGIWFMTN